MRHSTLALVGLAQAAMLHGCLVGVVSAQNPERFHDNRRWSPDFSIRGASHEYSFDMQTDGVTPVKVGRGASSTMAVATTSAKWSSRAPTSAAQFRSLTRPTS